MFVCILSFSNERSLITIIMAVIGILTVISALGITLSICNRLSMFYLKSRCFSIITFTYDSGKLVENFLTIKK